MSDQTTETEVWTRNVRGVLAKTGPWHLVKRRAERTHPWSREAECGVYPDNYAQRCDDRPTAGRLCGKCLKVADLRYPPGATS